MKGNRRMLVPLAGLGACAFIVSLVLENRIVPLDSRVDSDRQQEQITSHTHSSIRPRLIVAVESGEDARVPIPSPEAEIASSELGTNIASTQPVDEEDQVEVLIRVSGMKGSHLGSVSVSVEKGSPTGYLRGDSGGKMSFAFTDEVGECQLWLSPGNHRFVARLGTLIGTTASDLVPQEVNEIKIHLSGSISLQGRVLDEWSQAPIHGAEVWIQTLGRGLSAITDEAGLFKIDGVPANGKAQGVHFVAPGYGMESAWVIAQPNTSWMTRLAGVDSANNSPPRAAGPVGQGVAATTQKNRIMPSLIALVREGAVSPAVLPDVLLVPAISILGQVVSSDHTPIEGAQIEAVGYYLARPGMAFPDRGVAHSDAEGRFIITDLRSDVGHAVTLTAPGRGVSDLFAPPSSKLEFDCGIVQVYPELSLSGRVVDELGVPVEDGQVTVTDVDPPPNAEQNTGFYPRDAGYVLPYTDATRTDSNGKFKIDGLAWSKWRLVFSVGDQVWGERDFDLSSGVEPGPFEVVIPHGTPVIEGVVLRDGVPVEGASVHLRLGTRSRQVTSDSEGMFQAVGMIAGETYRIRATSTGQDGRVSSTAYQEAKVSVPVVLHLKDNS